MYNYIDTNMYISYIETMNVNHLVPRKLQTAKRVPQLQTPNKGAAPKAAAESGSEAPGNLSEPLWGSPQVMTNGKMMV